MKKFLLILLIAVAASIKVEFDATDLQSKWTDFWDNVLDFIESLPGKLKDLYDWLKENGIWEDLIELLEKYGVPPAIKLCIEQTGWDELCKDIIDTIINWIK